jgi:hypothetical protein
MANITKKSFDSMKFSPFTKKGESILDLHKDLSNIPELHEDLGFKKKGNHYTVPWDFDKEKIIKYILLTYDRHSPFYEITDVIQRKHEVGFFLEMDTKNKFPKEVQDMFYGRNEQVKVWINRIIRLYNSVKYSVLVSNIENLYRLLDSNDSDDIKVVKELEKDIAEGIETLLALDKNQALQETTFKFIHKENIQLWRPEAIAKDIKNGKKIMSGEVEKVTYESILSE